MKKVALVASAALAASSVFVIAQPASGSGAGGLVTRCTGSAGAVTVPGDLVVPRNRSCTLEGTTVEGNIRVAAGADILLEGVTLNGTLQVNADAYADVIGGSTITGQVRGRNAFGIFVEESTIGGDVTQASPGGTVPFVYLFQTGVGGAVTSTAGEVLVESSEVQGAVTTSDGEYTDLIDSVVGAGLSVSTNAFGSVVCESEIYGDTVYTGNSSTLQIGGSGAVGPCDGASYWGGDVSFVDNTAGETGFDISNNIVAGDLTGSGNDPLPTGAGNRVRGEITLEFADPEAGEMSLQEQSSRSAEIQGEAEVVADTRVAQLQAKVEERRAAAVSDAARTPQNKVLSPAPAD